MNEEKRKVISVLRSLVISSPQNGKSLRELVRDYCEFEGRKIPIFEHRTVEEFLRSSGEFLFENCRGETIIYGKPNAGSSHIAKLVAEQQKTKKRSTASSRFGPMRPLNHPQPRTAYPIRSPQKAIFPKRNFNTTPRTSPVHQQRTQTTSVEYSFDQLKSQNNANKSPTPGKQQPLDLRNRLNEIQRTKQTIPTVDLTVDSDPDSSRYSFASHENNNFVKTSPPISPKKIENSTIHPPLLTNNPFFDANNTPPPPTIPTSRMQDRLKNIVTMESNGRNVQNSVSNRFENKKEFVGERKSVQDRLTNARQLVSTGNAKPTPEHFTVTQSAQQSRPALQSNEVRLYDYCKEFRLNIPIFKIFKLNNRFQCHVTIDNIRYSTYPVDYASEVEARCETAKHALDRLDSIAKQQKYDTCLDNEVELANKIYACIKDCPTGVFSKNIPEKFQLLYSQLLPNDWMTTLAKHPECFTIEECIDTQIIYAVEAAELVQNMEKLQLPWNEEYWSLIITCTISTAEVWGRLIGNEHSRELDSLVTDIELELLKNKQIPTTFNVGQIYLVLMNECAYRVRVEKVNESRQQCLCFGVDEGDTRWYNMSEMYMCHNKFLKLAPQAIRFSLHGMEEYDENEFAQKHLEETLLNGVALVGQIFTKREEFISQDESSDLEAVIQVVLYDTSTPEDINLHQVIVEKICADIPAPELKHLALTQVTVSHISDTTGDIFIQVDQNAVHYVNKLIHKITNVANQQIQATNSSKNNLFLVFDDEMKRWCRAKLVNEVKELKANEMLLVDYGKTAFVPLTKIYRLESLSQALLTYPPQAVQVKLNGLTEFPEHMVSVLRGYFSGDRTAFVMKTSVSSFIPEVNLFFFKDNCMVNVNDSINLELQRQQSNEMSYSRQSSTKSNSSRGQDDLSNFQHLTLTSRKLRKFQPPGLNQYFDVEVVMTATPSNFHIRPMKYMQQWVQQMKSLQDHCNKSRSSLTIDAIRQGDVYACLHSDGKWYRAIVELKLNSKIVVSFCDLGDIDSIDDARKLKFLPDEYCDIPKLAINARLFGSKPKAADWEMDDIVNFNRLVTGKKFQAGVVNIIEKENTDENAVLEVWLIDVSGDEDVCINDSYN